MVYRFQGLRHYSVVGGHYQNGDIGYLGTVSTHGGKSLVARGIQEGNFLSVDLCLIGADMLGDLSGFGIHDVGFPDSVQQPGLAVVNVPHNGNHRRPRLQGTGLLTVERQALSGLGHGRLLRPAGHRACFVVIVGRYRGRRFIINDLVNIGHNAISHQLLDDIYGTGLQKVSQLPDAQGMRQLNRAWGGDCRAVTGLLYLGLGHIIWLAYPLACPLAYPLVYPLVYPGH